MRFLFDPVSGSLNGFNSGSKAPRSPQNGGSNAVTVTKKNSLFKGLINAKSEISLGSVVLELPIRTVSEANNFEHWTKRHKRHKSQQLAVMQALKPHRKVIQMPCKILLTRFAPKKLDRHDNLPMSFKYIVDICCAIISGNYDLGKADDDEGITIAYDQIKSEKYGIRIEITF